MTSEILDLAAIARILRRWRHMIGAGALAGAVIAGAAATWFVKYQSEGIYTLGIVTAVENRAAPSQFPKLYQFSKGIGIQDLKTEYPRLDSEHFRQYMDRRHVEQNRTLVRTLALLESTQSRSEVVSPLYGSTREDLRELGEQSKPAENLAIALHISLASRSPAEATSAANLVGEFVGETLFASQAARLITKRLEQYENQQLGYENELIKARFTIDTTKDKITALQTVRREFPDAIGNATRQVVSIADGGARYLSPGAQLVGMESTVADLRQEIAVNERAQNVARMLAGYYGKARQIAHESPSSSDLLGALEKSIDTLFVSQAPDSEAREARNDALLDLYALRALREQGLRFVSGPTDAWRDSSRIWKFALAGAALGALLVALSVLLLRATRDTTLE
ncbi:MAG TPA: hypothetical protein VN650_17950 [Gemmatimonadaceae bacterium]|nr:hypothetical protein [Gemmatimonadaceae bacterium]